MLSFTLLGQVRLYKDGIPLGDFRSQKEAALLIYLAHTGQTLPRETIAEMFWEGRSREQALGNLRTVLARLRQQVGDSLVVTRHSLALAAEPPIWVDAVWLTEQLSRIGQLRTTDQAGALRAALDRYQGDFLADFDLPDSPDFNQWLLTTREHLRRQVIAAYGKLGQYACDTGDSAQAIGTAHRWLQVAPLDEAAHTLLIRMLIAQGNTVEALHHYQACVELLKRELDVLPPAGMTALVTELQVQSARPFLPTALRHNLPPAYNQFFGRDTLQQDIHARLDQPWCRVVTLVGQGGVGKTRLATTIAAHRMTRYADGVWFVDLVPLDPDDANLAEAIAIEIISTLDIRLSGTAKPVEQLLQYLEHKRMLLLLDNFESVMGGLPLLLELLARCPYVQLLVTSREALRLQAEWRVPLSGLAYPSSDEDDMPSDALDLFLARCAQQFHEMTPEALQAARTICRMVEGLPLAIELAAALTSRLTPQSILQRLETGFAALVSPLRDVAARHRSLEVVFEMSWCTLNPDLRAKVAALAFWRGGFQAEAAHAVVGADQGHLMALVDKSLLSCDAESQRYRMHPLIQSFAAAHAAEHERVLDGHSRYYLTLLAGYGAFLDSHHLAETVRAIHIEMDNVRQAWHHGVSRHDAELLLATLPALATYYRMRGMAHEGEATMQATMSAASAWGDSGQTLRMHAAEEQARFRNRLGRFRSAMQSSATARTLAQQCGDPKVEGLALVWGAESRWRLGDYPGAEAKLRAALTIAEALGDPLVLGWSHHQLGIVHDIQGRYAAATAHLQRACEAWRTLGNTHLLSISQNSLGVVHLNQGDLSSAQEALQDALDVSIQVDDRHLHALILTNLSNISMEQNNYVQSVQYLSQSLALSTQNANLTNQAEILGNLGLAYRQLGDLEAAYGCAERAMHLAETIQNPTLMISSLYRLAEMEGIEDRQAQAERLYAQALQIARQYQMRNAECKTLIRLSELLGTNGDPRALDYSAEAVAIAATLEDRMLVERATALFQFLRQPESR